MSNNTHFLPFLLSIVLISTGFVPALKKNATKGIEVPTLIKASQINENSITITWDAPGDHAEIAGYKIMDGDGLLIANVPWSEAKAENAWMTSHEVIKIEAEELISKSWSLETSPEGYSGTGYIKAQKTIRPHPEGTLAPTDTVYNPADDFLTATFRIFKEGVYKVDARTIHFKEDGDNDVWMRYTIKDDAFHKVGNNKVTGDYAFLNWTFGGNPLQLKPGVYQLWFAPRSYGFGIDFIAIFPDDEKNLGGMSEPSSPEQIEKIISSSPSVLLPINTSVMISGIEDNSINQYHVVAYDKSGNTSNPSKKIMIHRKGKVIEIKN